MVSTLCCLTPMKMTLPVVFSMSEACFFALNKRTWIRLVLMIMSVELRNKCLNAYRQGNLVRKANKLFPRNLSILIGQFAMSLNVAWGPRVVLLVEQV